MTISDNIPIPLSGYNARDVVKELVTKHKDPATKPPPATCRIEEGFQKLRESTIKIEDGFQKLKSPASTKNEEGGFLKQLADCTTTKLEDGLRRLYTSMLKENEDMVTMQQYILNNIKQGMAALEQKLNTIEQELKDTHEETAATAATLTAGRNTLYVDNEERLNTIEINGIPLLDDERKLADTVCDILSQIGVIVETSDLVSCYQIPDAGNQGNQTAPPTVCRFSKRNICRTAHRNKKALRGVKIENIDSRELYINDYLCWYYKKLAAKCRRLKKHKHIVDTWTFKGIVKIRLLNETVRSIKHQVDLDRLFPNYNYFD